MSEARNTDQQDSSEVDQLLDHEYDGIQEYDNRLPNWWLWILYGSIVFSLAYWLFFHTFGIGNLQAERYDAEMVAAAEAQLARGGSELSNESLLLMSSVPERVEAGRQVYSQYCVACHATEGQGLVGPNLTDAYWIHGADPLDMHRVVTEGVIAKGMAAWGKQLGPRRVEAVTAYLLTIKDKNLPGKAPEGELVGN